MFKSLDVVSLDKVVPKKPNFILKDFMPIAEGTVGMIASAGGIGKTNLAIQLSSRYVKESTKNCLTWFSEDDEGVIKFRRDQMIESGLIEDVNEDHLFNIRSFPKQLAIVEKGIFKTNHEAIEGIKEDCRNNNIGLFIIDPLLAFYGGDENNNSQARIFMQLFLDWAKEDGITIIFIHHASKGDKGGARGAGAFVDALRTLYEIDFVYLDNGEIDFIQKDDGVRLIKLKKDNQGAYEDFQNVYGSGEGLIKVI